MSICQRAPGIKKVTVNHFTAHILNSNCSFMLSPLGKKALEGRCFLWVEIYQP